MLLKDKKILISGLANKYSIASGIASEWKLQLLTTPLASLIVRLLRSMVSPTHISILSLKFKQLLTCSEQFSLCDRE